MRLHISIAFFVLVSVELAQQRPPGPAEEGDMGCGSLFSFLFSFCSRLPAHLTMYVRRPVKQEGKRGDIRILRYDLRTYGWGGSNLQRIDVCDSPQICQISLAS